MPAFVAASKRKSQRRVFCALHQELGPMDDTALQRAAASGQAAWAREQSAAKLSFANDGNWPGLPVRRRRRQRPPGLPRAERPVFEALTSASRPKAGTQTFDLHAQKQTLSELDQCNLAAPHDFSRESALLFEERLLCSKRPCASRGQPTRSIVWRSASPGRFNDLLRCRRQLCPHRTTAQPASDSTARAMDIHPAVAASGMHNTWTATLTASPAT